GRHRGRGGMMITTLVAVTAASAILILARRLRRAAISYQPQESAMRVRSDFEQVAAEQGWNLNSQVEGLPSLIERNCAPTAFEAYLAERQDEEEAACLDASDACEEEEAARE